MKDVKSKRLFSRGVIGTLPEDLAAAMMVLLSHVNYVIYVLRALAPVASPTFFKIRFVSAYHAIRSLRILQEIARHRRGIERSIACVFKDLISDQDSKWIAQQLQLRNMLVHYGPKQYTSGLPLFDATFRDAVEQLSRGRTLLEIDATVDRFLGLISRKLEEGFGWSRDTFWYCQVK